MQKLFFPLLLLAPLATVGCGGASHTASAPAPASGLAYADPAGSGWRLVKDPASTPTRLVLALVGPAGLKTRGVGFNLQLPPTVKAGTFPSGLPIEDTGVYQLLSTAADPNEPVAITGGLKSGNLLSVGLYQKDRGRAAQDSGAPLCRVALVFDASAPLHAGDRLPLAILKARAIPEDIGSPSDDAWTLSRKLKMSDLSVAVGTLSAN